VDDADLTILLDRWLEGTVQVTAAQPPEPNTWFTFDELDPWYGTFMDEMDDRNDPNFPQVVTEIAVLRLQLTRIAQVLPLTPAAAPHVSAVGVASGLPGAVQLANGATREPSTSLDDLHVDDVARRTGGHEDDPSLIPGDGIRTVAHCLDGNAVDHGAWTVGVGTCCHALSLTVGRILFYGKVYGLQGNSR